MSVFNFIAPDIGIDLGTTNTLVYVEGKGILIDEPSAVAIDINDGSIVALGERAKEMIGKTPANIMAMRPIDKGIIADYEITQVMLSYFMEKAKKGASLISSRIVVSIPSQITDVERRAVEDAVMQAGARDVLLVEESLATAVGIGLNVAEPEGSMVINIGGGITEISLMSVGSIVATKSIPFGGQGFNQLIADYIEEVDGLIIGDQTAEELKVELLSMVEPTQQESRVITGRDKISGLPRNLELSNQGFSHIFDSYMDQLEEGIKEVLERTPPQLLGDIYQKGIYVSGGSSLMTGLGPRLESMLDIDFIYDENPLTSTALGTGALLKDFTRIKKKRLKYD